MYVSNSFCFDLFIDISNNLYCSMTSIHQVTFKSLNDQANIVKIAAGSGCSGSNATMLSSPKGIFVDSNSSLYVADANNNRIQLFKSKDLTGITVAGNGATNTITLKYPTDVVLDADGYLFIVDSQNNRIIASGSNGFRCIIGCFGAGKALNQLYYPGHMAFDMYGNIFVTDGSNNYRVQKFVLSTNTCSTYRKIQSFL